MTEKEKAALAWLNEKQNRENAFTNIGPAELARAAKRLEAVKNG